MFGRLGRNCLGEEQNPDSISKLPLFIKRIVKKNIMISKTNDFILENWSFMIRDVTPCSVSCNLSRNLSTVSDLFSNGKFLLAAQQKYSKTSSKRDDTLYNGQTLRCEK